MTCSPRLSAGWCLVPSMEKGFDRGLKNRISLFFVESPDFFHGSPDFRLPGVGRSVVYSALRRVLSVTCLTAAVFNRLCLLW